MFVEQLTVKDIEDFFKDKLVSGPDVILENAYAKLMEKNGEPYFYARIDYVGGYVEKHKMYDFHSEHYGQKWCKFLYKKFGKKYRDAYEAHELEVVKQKIKDLESEDY